jgi:hypothetical protein
MNRRDEILKTCKIVQSDDVQAYQDFNQEVFYTAPLNVLGGAAFQKGVRIGAQENLVPGIMIYDGENFLGFSEKFGLCLLNHHANNIHLDLPSHLFQKKTMIQSSESNDHRSVVSNDETQMISKLLNIRLEIKDISCFYIKIPEIYSTSNMNVTFRIELFFMTDFFISEIQLYFVNESNRPITFEFHESFSFRFQKDFDFHILPNQIKEIRMKRLYAQCICVSQVEYL